MIGVAGKWRSVLARARGRLGRTGLDTRIPSSGATRPAGASVRVILVRLEGVGLAAPRIGGVHGGFALLEGGQGVDRQVEAPSGLPRSRVSEMTIHPVVKPAPSLRIVLHPVGDRDDVCRLCRE